MMVEQINEIKNLSDKKFYKRSVLQGILKNLGLNFSIFTLRDYETWKCLDYTCGKRYDEEVKVCKVCGGKVRAPLINSPRTRGGGKGPGHRRYTKQEIENIVNIFKQRK